MARKHGLRSLLDVLPPEEQEYFRAVLEGNKPKATYVLRTASLKWKPITTSDPEYFLKVYAHFKKAYPALRLYVFKIVRGENDDDSEGRAQA